MTPQCPGSCDPQYPVTLGAQSPMTPVPHDPQCPMTPSTQGYPPTPCAQGPVPTVCAILGSSGPWGPPPEGGLAQRDGVPTPLPTPADDTPSMALTRFGGLSVLNVGLVTNITQVLLLSHSMDMNLSKLRRW